MDLPVPPEDIAPPNEKRDALRFLKRNPFPEESEEEQESDKAGPRGKVSRGSNDPCDCQGQRPFDRMALDRFGEELAPGAAIWSMYLDEAQEHDNNLVKGRQQSLDTLLLVAILFSILLSVFLVESKGLIRQDPSIALLLMISQSQHRIELGLPIHPEPNGAIATPEYTPPPFARWTNGFWFMSLGLSLSAALIAMIGKEWLNRFHSSRRRSTRSRAFIRQSLSRVKGLDDWGALHVTALPPALLHLSFILFSMGLVIYLWELDSTLAIIFTGAISVTLGLYAVSGILSAAYGLWPFVREVFQRGRRSLKVRFTQPITDSHRTSVLPDILDLKALIWLSKISVDPIVIDRAYQAIAGLHQSSYTVSDLAHPRPKSNSDFPGPDIATLDHGMSIESLLLQVSGRFDDLLNGKLETDSAEPPVCRYVNAMIALGSFTEHLSDAPLEHWMRIWEKINELWGSNLSEHSMSGSNFAGVLIAEMDALKFTMIRLQRTLPKSDMIPGMGVPIGPKSVETVGSASVQGENQTETPRPGLDKATSDLLLRIYNRLAEWLEVSLQLLQSYAKGEAKIGPYLVNGLLRATADGAYHLKCIYSVVSSRKPIGVTLESGENSLESLNILIFLLSEPTDSRVELTVTQLAEVLKIYSYIAPVMLQCIHQLDRSSFGNEFGFRDLVSSPLTCRREVLYLSVRYLMLSAGYLCHLLSEYVQCRPIFSDILELIWTCSEEERDHHPSIPMPRHGISYHMDTYIDMLEVVGSDQAVFELLTERSTNELCIFAIYPLQQNVVPAYGLYISPPLFLTLIRLYARSNLAEISIRNFIEFAVQRLRNPIVSLDRLPAQTSALPEPRPTIEYLQQITCSAEGFSALVRAGSLNDDYAEVVPRGIADITIIAANQDSTLMVHPVELQPPAVSAFLEALSWTLPRLSPQEGDGNVYKKFIISASILLVAACEDEESKEKIRLNSSRVNLTGNLRDDKEAYLGMISEEEWERLVNGLDLGEIPQVENNAGSDGASSVGQGNGPGGVWEEGLGQGSVGSGPGSGVGSDEDADSITRND